jgi:microcin C transport system permease protein
VLYGLSLFAEVIANDKPLLVQYQGGYYTPIWNFYPETEFGGDFRTEAVYRDIEVRVPDRLGRAGGLLGRSRGRHRRGGGNRRLRG